MAEISETSRRAEPLREAADAEALQREFDRLLSGAWSDLREAMALLRASEQRCADLAAELARERGRRVVRWANWAGDITSGLRRRPPGRG